MTRGASDDLDASSSADEVGVGRHGLVRRRPFGCLFEVVETLALTLVIFLVIQNFVAQPYEVQQPSMEHSFEPGDYVLVDKFSPRFDDYSRGDVIVFAPPPGFEEGGTTTPFIKRVIGLPGDTVAIHDSKVWVNGVAIVEPYVYDSQPTDPPAGQSTWIIPAGELLVLGDHRAVSEDSRVFGFIQKSSVIGRAWLRYIRRVVFRAHGRRVGGASAHPGWLPRYEPGVR